MLKKILLSLAFSSFFYGMPLTDDPSFQKICQQKEHTGKIILMMYSTKNCPQCAYMKQKGFKDEKVAKLMQQHMVVLEKDVMHDDLPDGFEYFGIPTMFFVDQNGSLIDTVIGSSRAEPFFNYLQALIGSRR